MERFINTLQSWGNGIVGAFGLFVGKVMANPDKALVWLSIAAVVVQLLLTGGKLVQEWWKSLVRICRWCGRFWGAVK